MARKTHHRHAFRALDADQRSWGNDPRYRVGSTWCGDSGVLFTEEERQPSAVRLADCPKCAANMGAHKLANAYSGRVELRRVEDQAERKDYSLRYARSAYQFILDGTLRGWIIAESGFGKGWRLRRVAGALGFVNDPDRECGDCVSGERPSRYSSSARADALFAPIHYVARDAMACAAIKAAERGELPTAEEQAERKAAQQAQRAEEAAQRARDIAESAARRARLAEETEERRSVARMGLEALESRDDLGNVERAALAAIRALLGMGVA